MTCLVAHGPGLMKHTTNAESKRGPTHLNIVLRGFLLGIPSQVLDAHVDNLLRYHALLEELCNQSDVAQCTHLGSPNDRLLLFFRHLFNRL